MSINFDQGMLCIHFRLSWGARGEELAKRAYLLYMDQDRDEQRKLVDLVASNWTLKDGVAHVELKEVFAILADGVAKEAEMEKAGASKEAINEEWLPGQEIARTFVKALLAA